MNLAVFPERIRTACRCCGALASRAGADECFGLCEWCGKRFTRWTKDDDLTENKCAQFLAIEILMQVRRVKWYGVVGRCEAMSGVDSNLVALDFPDQGKWQCRRFATMMRDGRRVCEVHGTISHHVVWCDASSISPYEQFTRLLREVADYDSRFRDCLVSALSK